MSKKIDWGSFAKGCVYTLLTALVLFVALLPSKPLNEDHIKQERKAREVEMTERLKTAELPATVITRDNEIFWVVDRYEHNPSFTEVLIEWSDGQREHRDIRTLAHRVQMVAGKTERPMVQIILHEWWMRRTMQVNRSAPISLPTPR